jgi:hypothetical protein
VLLVSTPLVCGVRAPTAEKHLILKCISLCLSVGTVTRLPSGQPRNLGLISGTEKRYFYILLSVRTHSLWVLSASHSVSTGDFSLGLKRSGSEIGHSL